MNGEKPRIVVAETPALDGQWGENGIMRSQDKYSTAMDEWVAEIDPETGEPVVEERPALEPFTFQGGYSLELTDLGSTGIKVELFSAAEGSRAVVLPPDKVQQCIVWMLNALALDKGGMLGELTALLEECIGDKETLRKLGHPEHKKVKEEVQRMMSKCPPRSVR